MENVIKAVGYEPESDESVTMSLLRQEILHLACTLGHDVCNQDSKDKFIAMKNENIWYIYYINSIQFNILAKKNHFLLFVKEVFFCILFKLADLTEVFAYDLLGYIKILYKKHFRVFRNSLIFRNKYSYSSA